MNNIRPIFDSLSHPQINSKWNGRIEFLDSSFSHLVDEMKLNNIIGSVASFYPSNKNELFSDFEDECKYYENQNPPIQLKPCYMIRDQINIFQQEIMQWSNHAGQEPLLLKFHPEYCSPSFYLEKASHIKSSIQNKKIIWYICTYPFCMQRSTGKIEFGNILEKLAKIVGSDPLVMLHGGTVELLKYSQYAQHFKNIYIDLSFTICRYINSSLLYDMAYLFEYLDQKIIVGTDHPEYSYLSLRKSLKRVEDLFYTHCDAALADEKLNNIYYRNMLNLLKTGK